MPLRIGQVTVSVARIERVAAMHAGLDLRLGSHTVRIPAIALDCVAKHMARN